MFEQEKDLIGTAENRLRIFSPSPMDAHLVTWRAENKVHIFRLLPLPFSGQF